MNAPLLRGDAEFVLVDDSATERQLARTCYAIAAVSNPWLEFSTGPAFLNYLKRVGEGAARRPALVLVDINMPVLDGFALVERVRSEAIFVELPLLIFTSSDDPKDERRALVRGATAVVRKPDGLEDYVAFFRELAGLAPTPEA